MSSPPRSLVAERAARYLAKSEKAESSRDLAAALLATRTADESAAQQLLAAAFGGDPRLEYRDGRWHLNRNLAFVPEQDQTEGTMRRPSEHAPGLEADRALIFLDGGQVPGEGFRMTHVAVLRCCGEDVIAACGGSVEDARSGGRLCRSVRETLFGAVPILHDPPGSIAALERWLQQPLESPISLRQLARDRLGLPARHSWDDLMGQLKIAWRETDDPLERSDQLDSCLQRLCRAGETLEDLRREADGGEGIDWHRFDFNRDALQAIPATPGTYRFFDADGALLYVGKSRNLRNRLASYFVRGSQRSERVRKIVERLHRFEIEPSGSELDAILQEAEAIRRDHPERNVQRQVHSKARVDPRMRSILILEPGCGNDVLKAYLIHQDRLVGSVGIGPRGGGLRKIERLLEDRFFRPSGTDGPRNTDGPDLEVELVIRWLSANRDRVVAFDPTDLSTSREVIERLRWFLDRGSPFDPDGSPILSR